MNPGTAFFLTAAAADSPASPSPIFQFLPLIFLFVIFYFLLIRPQQKRQKDHEQLVSKLQKNDEVVTTGGLHATVVAVNDKTVTLRIADNVRAEFDKTAVATVKK